MKFVNTMNPCIGFALAIVYIFIFDTLRHGGYLAVLHHIEATTEMVIAIILTLWFAWQIPYQMIKAIKGEPKGVPE